MKKIPFIIVALLALGLNAVQPVRADDDGIICASVFPCDDNGDILAPFDDESSACYPKYLKQCYEMKNDLLKQCEVTSDELSGSVRSLKKKIKKLRSNIRAAGK